MWFCLCFSAVGTAGVCGPVGAFGFKLIDHVGLLVL